MKLYIFIVHLFNEGTRQFKIDFEPIIAEEAAGNITSTLAARLEHKHPGFTVKTMLMEEINEQRLFEPWMREGSGEHYHIVIQSVG